MTAMRISLSTRQWVLTGLGLILVLYIIFQARFIILGPSLTILYPKDAAEVVESTMTMTGIATNVAWLELNGRQIFTDEEGYWSEKLLLQPGPSIMTVKGRDRFGREEEKQVRVILINTGSINSPQDAQEQEN
jgi:hypothetical protein